jgi:uncharacterized sporulation protein YeaH/YhbH (DUF444 family)
MSTVVDRTNESGKGLKSRDRFIRRTRAEVRKAIDQDINAKSIKDFGKGGVDVTVPQRGLTEPHFHNGKGGVNQGVLPGNDNENARYRAGDRLPRPSGGSGGSEGSPDGDGEDDFKYRLSEQEVMDLILEDLELPNMHKRGAKDTENTTLEHAGFSHTGTFNRLHLVRSKFEKTKREIFMNKGANEKILALLGEERDILSQYNPESRATENVLTFGAPSAKAKIRALEVEIKGLKENFLDEVSPKEKARIAEIGVELAPLYEKKKRVGKWREHDDLRFRAVEEEPAPTSQAVMFCQMDVSGSMTEEMKANAKMFYILLYRFLVKKYDNVDVVFIRHAQDAKEVDEQTFFESPETGGTVVSSVHEKLLEIQKRYPADKWNMYAAQASDGDNTVSDNEKTSLLMKKILPMMQGFFYIETGSPSEGVQHRDTNVWTTYEPLAEQFKDRFWMQKVAERKDIVPIFRELFKKRPQNNYSEPHATAFGL